MDGHRDSACFFGAHGRITVCSPPSESNTMPTGGRHLPLTAAERMDVRTFLGLFSPDVCPEVYWIVYLDSGVHHPERLVV